MGYTQVAKQYAPWRRDIAWWIVLIQGLVLGGIGLYALIGEGAAQTLVLFLGIYALVHSLWIVFSSWRRPAESRALLHLVSAGVGLLAGVVVVFHSYFVNLPPVGALVVFALGLVITGVLGILASFAISGASGFPWGVLVRGLIDLGLGVYLGYAVRTQTADAVEIIGWLGTIGGVLLIGYAIFLFWNARRANQAPSQSNSAAGQAPPPAATGGTPEVKSPSDGAGSAGTPAAS